MIGLAVLMAALAGWVGVRPADPLGRLRPPSSRTGVVRQPWGWLGLACAGLVLAGVIWPGVVPVALVGLIGSTVGWLVAGQLERRRAADRRRQSLRVAEIMESMLALGHLPSAAIGFAAEECALVAPVAAAVQLGGNPWEVLRQLAGLPGGTGLAWIGQAWQASHISGGGLVEALGLVRATMESQADTAAVVTAELAGPRATSQLLAVLPLLGLAAAWALGVDLVHFFGSRLGGFCLLSGVGLACAGLIWSEMVARRAEPGRSQVGWSARNRLALGPLGQRSPGGQP